MVHIRGICKGNENTDVAHYYLRIPEAWALFLFQSNDLHTLYTFLQCPTHV
jgi:hypothetical protein